MIINDNFRFEVYLALVDHVLSESTPNAVGGFLKFYF